MVKNRLLKWNLHKKLSLPEVRTALEMLGHNRETWPCEHPQFRIRNKIVSLDNILRSCRRRGIHDPFDWIQRSPQESQRSSNVQILTPPSSAGSDSDSEEPATMNFVEAATDPACQVEELHHDSQIEHVQDIDDPCLACPLPIHRMRDPQMYVLAAQAIQQFQLYCRSYIASEAAATKHQEPAVHQFTPQGRLQDHIDEGVFHFARKNFEAAFASFSPAFLLLEELLADVHPMSMAQYLMLLCRLTVTDARIVAIRLLRQALDLSRTRKRIAPSLMQALEAVYRSGELVEMPLLCLRAAVDCMDNMIEWQWKGLYMKERYCHALFTAGFSGEGTLRRAKLLEEQQSFYGVRARNALWTALIVAEDCVGESRLHEAEQRFNWVLQESQSLSGFHHAKIRVVGLAGLARIAIARARKACDAGSQTMSDPDSREAVLQQTDLAEIFVIEALELADKWFERSATRRVERLRDLQAEILDLSLQARFSIG